MKKTNKQRTRPEDGAETRLLIMQVGRDLFMTYGFRAVSTRQIALACGLTQPALYRHFRDKEALYIDVLLHELETVNQALLQQIEQGQRQTVATLRLLARYLSDTPHDLSWMFHDLEHEIEPESRQRVRTAFWRQFLQPVADVFGQGFRSGELHTMEERLNPETAAMMFLNYLKQQPGKAPREDWPDTVVDLLLYGISAQPNKN
ncbi:TetR/AcrR family transcriptional regulator [Paenibacillus sp. JX-17]|uniref:TetR/AcrR family transcriptional regulator n=1 Tax=Paenibacillus lacisoli TaxID=3064525 RepID=A0ABT9CAI3_9BACL|nr:TetR/AcrR family transcriptional regulator [Paenibacillus sp. JX-17]